MTSNLSKSISILFDQFLFNMYTFQFSFILSSNRSLYIHYREVLSIILADTLTFCLPNLMSFIATEGDISNEFFLGVIIFAELLATKSPAGT